MSLQYDEYLKEHIQNVTNGLLWMTENLDLRKLGISDNDISSAMEAAGNHDQSKFGTDEYRAYDDYFYGDNKSYAVKTAFDLAWLHHQHVNPHHWQYWVLINDDDGVNKALPMPTDYILEMIADWWSFSWREGNLMEIFDWYDTHKDKMILHDKTRKLMENILKEMRKVLEMQQKHEKSYMDFEEIIEEPIVHSDTEEDEHQYGVPEQKKFPLPDADHVRSAIRFFNWVDPKYEKELAKAILEKMDEYEMSFDDFGVGDENRFKKYIPKEDLKDSEEKSK